MNAEESGDVEAGEAEELVWAYHGLVMNGGVAHAIEVGTEPEVALNEVLDAFRAFGLDDLAALLHQVAQDDGADDEATNRWSDIIPLDATLEARMRDRTPG